MRVSTASSTSSGLWSEKLQRICAIMWDLKSFQFVRGETRVGGRSLCSMWVRRVAIIGVWSEERSPLLSICIWVVAVPLRTKKSRRSGSLFGSEGH